MQGLVRSTPDTGSKIDLFRYWALETMQHRCHHSHLLAVSFISFRQCKSQQADQVHQSWKPSTAHCQRFGMNMTPKIAAYKDWAEPLLGTFLMGQTLKRQASTERKQNLRYMKGQASDTLQNMQCSLPRGCISQGQIRLK